MSSNEILELFLFLTHDKVTFWAFEILLAGIVIYAYIRDLSRKGSGIVVQRGKESQKVLPVVFSAIISLVITQIINVSQEGQGYKVLITIIDILCVFYISLFNNWGRNRIIGFYNKFTSRAEEL